MRASSGAWTSCILAQPGAHQNHGAETMHAGKAKALCPRLQGEGQPVLAGDRGTRVGPSLGPVQLPCAALCPDPRVGELGGAPSSTQGGAPRMGWCALWLRG